MRVAFRADASVTIGIGHVMRCLTLAHALADRGAAILFVSREHPGDLCDHVAGHGFAVVRLPRAAVGGEPTPTGTPVPGHAAWLGAGWEEDAGLTERAIDRWGAADWLVVDHYALDARWETALRPRSGRLMVIDDIADRRHDCDLLLDQNRCEDQAQRYAGLVPASCRTLLGPGFALLRPEFVAARAGLRVRSGEVRRILIFFGGADATNESGKAVRAFLSLGRADIEADVVVGAANPHRDELASQCAAHPGLRFHCQAANMAELMAAADLSVGAGGSASWERCCVGLPAIVVAAAANQLPIARGLADEGACRFLGDSRQVSESEIADALTRCLRDPDGLRLMSRRGMALVDGEGSQRVRNAMAS